MTAINKRAVARLECSACGATADAACDCGVPYLSAGRRAEEAVKASPEKSDRAIADEIGVGRETVRRARKSTDPHGAVETRTGKDGKTRVLPKRHRTNKSEPSVAYMDVESLENVPLETLEAMAKAHLYFGDQYSDLAQGYSDLAEAYRTALNDGVLR